MPAARKPARRKRLAQPLQVRMPQQLRDGLAKVAQMQRRSMSQTAALIIEAGVLEALTGAAIE